VSLWLALYPGAEDRMSREALLISPFRTLRDYSGSCLLLEPPAATPPLQLGHVLARHPLAQAPQLLLAATTQVWGCPREGSQGTGMVSVLGGPSAAPGMQPLWKGACISPTVLRETAISQKGLRQQQK